MRARLWLSSCFGLFLCLPAHAQVLEFPPLNTFVFSDPDITGLAVMDDQTVYLYWNERMVTVPAITAVELSSGRHLWSKPAKLNLPTADVVPRTFQVEEGWLLYETFDGRIGDPRHIRPSQRTLHVVNGQTGEQQILPRANPNHPSYVSTPVVHRSHSVTYDGTVVRCSDGQIVGELGQGDHYPIIGEGDHLFVMTTTEDRASADGAKRFVRKFDVTTMTLLTEMEFPLQNFSPLVAAKGNIAVFASQSDDRRQLFCIDLSDRREQWRITFPNDVSPFDFQWNGNTELVFHLGTNAIIRPVRVNIANGHLAPDADWIDPRSMLGWYQSRRVSPDFVVANRKFIIGRWQQQVICVDPFSGQLLWKHVDSEDCVGRLFTERTRLGEYFVAGTSDRFNIVSVATGETRSIRLTDVGLTAAPPRRPLASDIDTIPGNASDIGSTEFDRVNDALVLATPLLPLVVWLIWWLFGRRGTIRKGDPPGVR